MPSIRQLLTGKRKKRRVETLAPELTKYDVETIELARSTTMTSPQRLQALILAMRYVHRRKLEGAIVECGVWRGGSMFTAARTLLDVGDTMRDLYLYDTFSGMPPPDSEDTRRSDGASAAALMADPSEVMVRAEAGLDVVKATMARSGYPAEKLHYIQGKVEETIPQVAPPSIALLRLDTDWYGSTLHELEHLYPRLVHGGVLIIDDYGWWEGARRAVDEYFGRHEQPPLLNVIDESGRVAIRA